MMLKRASLALSLFIFVFLVWVGSAQAGFGIQPPYVKPEKPIFAGTSYEQKITLLRSAADADMEATVKVIAPEIDGWISIDKGYTFDLPRDQLKVPMVVRVDVPSNAPIGNYKGSLNVRIAPKQDEKSPGVAIALGARVEVDITVTDESFIDFVIRKVDIPAIEQLKSPWDLKIFSWFLYRLEVVMKIENTGNTKVAPSKVQIEIYDNAKDKLIETHVDKNIDNIEPFKTQEVNASFPVNLEPGEYWGKISIYQEKEILQKNEIIFTVYENGKSPNGLKLGKLPFILVTVYSLLLLLLIFVLIRLKVWRHLWLIFMVLTWPIRFIWKLILKLLSLLNKKFWKWMHKKASKYQDRN